MKLRIILIVMTMVYGWSTAAQSVTAELLGRYNVDISDTDSKIKFLNSCRTISFKPKSHRNYRSLTREIPDTLWLKERPKKKAKEGKHYRLIWPFAGEPTGYDLKKSDIITPATALDKMVFRIEKAMLTSPDTCCIYMYLTGTSDRLKLKFNINDGIGFIPFSLQSVNDWFVYNNTAPYHLIAVYDHFHNSKHVTAHFDRIQSLVNITRNGNLRSSLKLWFTDDRNNTYTEPASNEYLNPEHYTIFTSAEYDNLLSPLTIRSSNYVMTDSQPSVNRPKPVKVGIKRLAILSQRIDRNLEIHDKKLVIVPKLAATARIPLADSVYICGVTGIADRDYYKAVAYGKVFFVDPAQLNLGESDRNAILQLKAAGETECDNLIAATRFETTAETFGWIDRNFFSDEKQQLPILITEFRLAGDPRYNEYSTIPGTHNMLADRSDIRIKFDNNSKKDIKEIRFFITGYDADGKPVVPYGFESSTVILKSDGETPARQSSTLIGFDPWVVNGAPVHAPVKRINLESIEIRYKNGSRKTIKPGAKAMMDETDTMTLLVIETIKDLE